MRIVEQLKSQASWEAYLSYKANSGHISKRNLEDLQEYIKEKRYLASVEKVMRGEAFQTPEKKYVNKIQKSKKRIVYVFEKNESYVLKLLTYLLIRKYDEIFAPNLYSFRSNTGVKNAISFFAEEGRTDERYSYKVDISNYFNSVKVELLLPKLEEILKDDPEVYDFIRALLMDPYVVENGQLIKEEKGIMAGSPLAAFLANVYLCDLDWSFYKSGVLYGRYSDDIIIFTRTEEELEESINRIKNTIDQRGLSINSKKENTTKPHERWMFLGMSYEDGIVDVSEISAEKLKQKMRRKSRALLRWRRRKGEENERAARAFIRAMNRKLYDNPVETEMTWVRWYFPMINTTQTLREIDHYMQDCIRYIMTEKRNKGRYSCTYEEMKQLGYRSLVHEYYKKKEEE